MTLTRAALTVLAAALLSAPAPAAGPPANEFCPVMPDQAASPAHAVDFRGRTVHFCCADCAQKFFANPDPYLDHLPAPPSPPPLPHDPLVEFLNWAQPGLVFTERHRAALGFGLFVTVLALFAGRLAHGAAKRGRPPGWGDRLLAPLARPVTLGFLLLAAACADLWADLGEARAALAESKTAPRADAAGRFPRSAEMLAWAWPQGFHELPKGVQNTYYRGNDERSAKLFNGGKYRTATFGVALQTEDGAAARAGEKYAGRSLQVRLDIVRAPGTSPNFFQVPAMARVYLAKADDPTQKPVPLAVERADWAWSAAVPITPAAAADGYTGARGVWYVCVGPNFKPDLATAVIHYYVQYVLHFQDGVLLPGSGVWMLPVYPSPILNGPTADAEWFSDRPIPEIVGANTTDPKLLGVPGTK